MQVNSINNTSFTGIPITKVKISGLDSDYRLYEVGCKDLKFLNRMYKSVDLQKLYHGLSPREYALWDGLLKNSFMSGIFSSGKKVFLETCDNIPCGIMTYTPNPKHYTLNYIVTFPHQPNKKVHYAGQILFNELFRRFLPQRADDIELDALRNAPFSPISKYLRLGFRMCGGDDLLEKMQIKKTKVRDTFSRQNEFIISEPLMNQQDEDLNKTVKLLEGFSKDRKKSNP